MRAFIKFTELLLLCFAIRMPMAQSAQWDTSKDGLWQYQALSAREGCEIKPSTALTATDVTIPCEITRSDGNKIKVIRIAEKAFDNAKTITSATLAQGIEEIGKWAFASCSKLQRAIIPASVKTIDEYAFLTANYLKAIYLLADADAIAIKGAPSRNS